MQIEDLLSQLGTEMNAGPLTLDEDGTCTLVFDETLVIEVAKLEDGRRMHMKARLCDAPDDPQERERMFEAILEGNLFGQGTGEAGFALDEGLDEVCLCQGINLERTDYRDFCQALEAFLNFLEDWHKRIERGELAVKAGGGAMEPAPFMGFIRA